MSIEISEIELIDEKGDVVGFDLVPYEDSEDPNTKSHFIRGEENSDLWQDGMIAQDVVDAARMLGVELVALCGYRWVPKHDPAKHDICNPCMEIWEALA